MISMTCLNGKVKTEASLNLKDKSHLYLNIFYYHRRWLQETYSVPKIWVSLIFNLASKKGIILLNMASPYVNPWWAYPNFSTAHSLGVNACERHGLWSKCYHVPPFHVNTSQTTDHFSGTPLLQQVGNGTFNFFVMRYNFDISLMILLNNIFIDTACPISVIR